MHAWDVPAFGKGVEGAEKEDNARGHTGARQDWLAIPRSRAGEDVEPLVRK